MWATISRPGYFGRKRDEKVAALNREHGVGRWRLAWILDHQLYRDGLDFFNACRTFYEEAYFHYLVSRPEGVDFICQYSECFDNAESNTLSGLDYMIQEAYSTHIQDIAIRNVLRRLGRWFENKNGRLLQIRSKDSSGYMYGPGNVPFHWERRQYIISPSLCPSWANAGSVEDFWQSNKVLQIWKPA